MAAYDAYSSEKAEELMKAHRMVIKPFDGSNARLCVREKRFKQFNLYPPKRKVYSVTAKVK